MPTDLHFVCKHELNHRRIGGEVYETGDWSNISTKTANGAVGGRVYLHETKSANAWHGGTITAWHGAQEGKKVFRYVVDGPFRIRCPGRWGQEKAIVHR